MFLDLERILVLLYRSFSLIFNNIFLYLEKNFIYLLVVEDFLEYYRMFRLVFRGLLCMKYRVENRGFFIFIVRVWMVYFL